jgi:hypothetical protein
MAKNKKKEAARQAPLAMPAEKSRFPSWLALPVMAAWVLIVLINYKNKLIEMSYMVYKMLVKQQQH